MSVPAPKLREELVEQLHRANAHVHETKQAWEQSMDASEYRHEEHVRAAAEKLQSAERDVEAIEKKIAQAYEMKQRSA